MHLILIKNDPYDWFCVSGSHIRFFYTILSKVLAPPSNEQVISMSTNLNV